MDVQEIFKKPAVGASSAINRYLQRMKKPENLEVTPSAAVNFNQEKPSVYTESRRVSEIQGIQTTLPFSRFQFNRFQASHNPSVIDEVSSDIETNKSPENHPLNVTRTIKNFRRLEELPEVVNSPESVAESFSFMESDTMGNETMQPATDLEDYTMDESFLPQSPLFDDSFAPQSSLLNDSFAFNFASPMASPSFRFSSPGPSPGHSHDFFKSPSSSSGNELNSPKAKRLKKSRIFLPSETEELFADALPEPSIIFEPTQNFNTETQSCGFDDSASSKDQLFLDETLLPERCRNKTFEQSMKRKEKITVNTAYRYRDILSTKPSVIENFYKVQKITDWEAFAQDLLASADKIMEPNMDYFEDPNKIITIGDSNTEIQGYDSFGCDEINETLEEIEKSFENPEPGFCSSTPNRVKKESEDFEMKNDISAVVTNIKVEDLSEDPSEYVPSSVQPEDKIPPRRYPTRYPSASKQNAMENQVGKASDTVQSSIPGTSVSQIQPQPPPPQEPQTNDDEIFNFSRDDLDEILLEKFAMPSSFGPRNITQFTESEEEGFSEREQMQKDFDSSAINSYYMKIQLSQKESETLTQQKPGLADARRSAILTHIQNIFYTLLESLVQGKPMVMKMRRIKNWSDCELNNEVLTQKEISVTMKSVSFGNKASQRKFTVTINILCEIYKMLARNLMITKRELYYRDVELYRNQETVNRAIDTICNLLNVQEYELGVLSSSKGLVAGDLVLILGDERIDCAFPQAVPSNPSAITSIETNAEYILVVEKDTVFQRLVNEKIFDRIGCKIALITAKGYPDVNTRTLLKKISTLTDKPIYIIVDADPHGVEIMCTYKYGSLMKVFHSEHLAVPKIEWIGIHPTDIESLDVPNVDLTPADLKKVDELLERPYVNQQLQSELNCFKSRKLKAEIESIYQFSIDFLIKNYIPRKIQLAGMPNLPMFNYN